ncbi:MAG: hypothetical protein M3173_00910 [Chloroflexota bacterium]|nr:hypothetical protein [Chloroflexota bacterium]
MKHNAETIRVEGENGSTLSWLLTVQDQGGEGNSRAYRISVHPEETGSHISGNPSWEFTILGEWEISTFQKVLRELSVLVERVISNTGL